MANTPNPNCDGFGGEERGTPLRGVAKGEGVRRKGDRDSVS